MSGDEAASRFPHLAGKALAFALASVNGDGSVAVTHDAFDSEVFDQAIGRIVDVRPSATVGHARLLSAAASEAEASGFAQLLRRTNAGDLHEVWALGATGFELMDVGVTFARRTNGEAAPADAPGMTVRAATDADITALADGMLHLAWGSRYESDPTYAARQVHSLRTRWLWNSHRGRAEVVLVAEIDGQAASFVTCVLVKAERTGDIELVGTLPAFRGRGAASHLVAHALAFFSARADIVTVRTQATNLAAARVYERAGFTMHASDLTFRRLLHGAAS